MSVCDSESRRQRVGFGEAINIRSRAKKKDHAVTSYSVSHSFRQSDNAFAGAHTQEHVEIELSRRRLLHCAQLSQERGEAQNQD